MSTKKPPKEIDSSSEEFIRNKHRDQLMKLVRQDVDDELMRGILHYRVAHESRSLKPLVNKRASAGGAKVIAERFISTLNERPDSNAGSRARNEFSPLDLTKAKRAVELHLLSTESKSILSSRDDLQWEDEMILAQDKLLIAQSQQGLLPLALFKNCKVAFVLDLNHLSIGDNHGLCLSESISDLRSVRSIHLQSNRLTSLSLTHIINSIKDLSLLSELNLSYNNVHGEGCQALANYFCCLNGLQTLNLWHTDITNTDIQLLCRSFCIRSHHLLNLNISSNQISMEGIHYIKSYLIHDNCNLEYLDLSWNEVHGVGAKLLSEALYKNTTLKSLNLSSSAIPDEAGEQLIAALQSNAHLEVLDLSCNNIRSRSCFVLAKLLRHFHVLEIINLSENPIGEPGGRCLFREIMYGQECQIILHNCTYDIDDSLLNYTYPEGEYQLNLKDPYESACLDELITIVERNVSNCKFESISHDASSFPISLTVINNVVCSKNTNQKWNPPTNGNLKITFAHKVVVPTVDMAVQTNSLLTLIKLLQNAKNAADRKNILMLAFQDMFCMTVQVQEFIDLVKSNRLIRKGDLQVMDVFVNCWGRIIDSENKFDLLYRHFKKDDRKELAFQVSYESYKFLWTNPTGHYNLNLSNDVHFKLMSQISAINSVESDFSKMYSKRQDTSQYGNWNNFRNVIYGGKEIILDAGFLSKLPRLQRVSFDYVSTTRPSTTSIQTIKFEEMADLLNKLGLDHARRLDPSEFSFLLIELQLASAKYYFRTKDVLTILDAILILFSSDYKLQSKIVIVLFSRIWDLHNFDWILRQIHESSSHDIAKRLGIASNTNFGVKFNTLVGWLNILNPLKPAHRMQLPMQYVDNRIVIVMLLDLSGKEEGEQIEMAPNSAKTVVELYGQMGRILQTSTWKDVILWTYSDLGERTFTVAWSTRKECVKKCLVGTYPLHPQLYDVIDMYNQLKEMDILRVGSIDVQYEEYRNGKQITTSMNTRKSLPKSSITKYIGDNI